MLNLRCNLKMNEKIHNQFITENEKIIKLKINWRDQHSKNKFKCRLIFLLYCRVWTIVSNRKRIQKIKTMSEGCTSCRGANYTGSSLQLGSSSNGTAGGSAPASGSSCTAARRVQVRAKVLYGSGKAIASLQAQEKAARHWQG